MKITRLFFVLVMLAAFAGSQVIAQDDAVASDLNNPRQLFYGADGTLYIAEAGAGGDAMATGVFGNEVPVGATARITAVSPDGEQAVLLDELASVGTGQGPSAYGAHAVYVDDTTIWVAMGEGPATGTYDEALIFNALVAFDRETLEVTQNIDLKETADTVNDPADVPNNSNPVDIAVGADGTVYVANAGCNCIQSWTEADGVQIAAQWPTDSDNPVPTSVAVDANGDLYVGFLTGFPWPMGEARVERWSGGELADTFTGLTTVTDIVVAEDGTIYAVEHGVGQGENGAYGEGRVVSVSADGVTPVLEGLMMPYGLAIDAAGNLVVSVGSAGEAGAGQVVSVPAG
jgi:biopolymer transport protein ExbD